MTVHASTRCALVALGKRYGLNSGQTSFKPSPPLMPEKSSPTLAQSEVEER